ncbi:MAG TPA: SoxR reducing system RseC family protein [Gammaproteobacteria bacterium]|nr:SoxR reducing system RseC family protein [Gammaproteobacteria bacterium]
MVRASDREHIAVEFAAPPRCKGCGGACLWYRVPPSEELTLAASPAIPVGATVAVTLPDRYLLLGAVLVYGVPLAALLAGAGTAAALFGTDLAVAAGAVLALAAAVAAASFLRGRLERATLRHLAVRRVS